MGSIITVTVFSLTSHAHYTLNKPVLKTGKFRPEIWSAASSNNSSEAGRGLSPVVSFRLVVRDLLAGKHFVVCGIRMKMYCTHVVLSYLGTTRVWVYGVNSCCFFLYYILNTCTWYALLGISNYHIAEHLFLYLCLGGFAKVKLAIHQLTGEKVQKVIWHLNSSPLDELGHWCLQSWWRRAMLLHAVPHYNLEYNTLLHSILSKRADCQQLCGPQQIILLPWLLIFVH